MRLLVQKTTSTADSTFRDALIDVVPDDGTSSPGIRLSPSTGLEVTIRSTEEVRAALDALRVKQLQLLRERSKSVVGPGQRRTGAGESGIGTVRRGAVRFRNATIGQISESFRLQSAGTGDTLDALILAIDLSSGIDDAIDLIGDAIGALGDILGDVP